MKLRDDRPADINFARGTFTCIPMRWRDARLPDPLGRAKCRRFKVSTRWDGRAAALNARLEAAGHPARRQSLVDLTILYSAPAAITGCSNICASRDSPELGRHRPADLQPQLQRCRLLTPVPTAYSPPPRGWRPTAGGTARRPPTRRSGAGFSARSSATGAAVRRPPRPRPRTDRPPPGRNRAGR